jgi:hypothetical protein
MSPSKDPWGMRSAFAINKRSAPAEAANTPSATRRGREKEVMGGECAGGDDSFSSEDSLGGDFGFFFFTAGL